MGDNLFGLMLSAFLLGGGIAFFVAQRDRAKNWHGPAVVSATMVLILFMVWLMGQYYSDGTIWGSVIFLFMSLTGAVTGPIIWITGRGTDSEPLKFLGIFVLVIAFPSVAIVMLAGM